MAQWSRICLQCRKRAKDAGLIPRSGRLPGEGNGNRLQYSYLGNPMDRGAWQAIVHGVAKGGKRLNMHTRRHKCIYDRDKWNRTFKPLLHFLSNGFPESLLFFKLIASVNENVQLTVALPTLNILTIFC